MSLVVARKFDGKLVVAADTRIFDSRSRAPKPVFEGKCKIRFVKPNLAICFAGNDADLALAGVARITADDDLSSIKDKLKCHRDQHSQSIDYLICSIEYQNIQQLKSHDWEDVEVGWIGHQEAYRQLRAHETGNAVVPSERRQNTAEFSIFRLPDLLTEQGQEAFSNFKRAFDAVIAGQQIVEVGDFCTIFNEEAGIFIPATYTTMNNNRLDLSNVTSEPRPIPAGTVQDGSHTFEFLSSNLGHYFVGFHFLMGGFGVFFPSGLTDRDPILIRGNLPDEFEYEAEQALGFGVRTSTASAGHLFAFGHRYLSTNLVKACWGFERCLERTELNGQLYKLALAHRGLARAVGGDFESAIADCTSAIDCTEFRQGVFECRGTVFAIVGRFREAVEDLTTAIDAGDHHPLLFQKRAEYYGRLGMLSEMQADLVSMNTPRT